MQPVQKQRDEPMHVSASRHLRSMFASGRREHRRFGHITFSARQQPQYSTVLAQSLALSASPDPSAAPPPSRSSALFSTLTLP